MIRENSPIQLPFHSKHSKSLLLDVKNGIALNCEPFYSKITTSPFGFNTEEHPIMNEPLQGTLETPH
jgi:hypothetical protein